MLLFVVIILFGILAGIFATQNTGLTSITLANYKLSGIPMYVVALGSLLIGVVVSWVLSIFGAVSSFFTLAGKDSKISGLNRSLIDMRQKIRDLEVENAKLKRDRDSYSPCWGILRKPELAE